MTIHQSAEPPARGRPVDDNADGITTVPAVEPPIHPLLALIPRSLHWGTWMRRWNDPDTTVPERDSLLHHAFDIHTLDRQQRADRVILLLSLADGHDYGTEFTDPSEDLREQRVHAEQRQALADKAFKVLCSQFFSLPPLRPEYSKGYQAWIHDAQLPSVLDQLIWFVRPGRFGGITNMPANDKSAQYAIFRGFLSRLWQLCWNFHTLPTDGKGFPRRLDEQESAFTRRLVEARTQLLHIPLALGQHAQLLNYGEVSYALDEDCSEWLLARAMAPRRSGSSLVTPDSLEHALALGSVEALVLIVNHVVDVERERQQDITNALRRSQEAERALTALRQVPQSAQPAGRVLHQSDDSS